MVDIITASVLFALLVATIWRPPVAYSAVVVTFALEQWAQASGAFFAQHSALLNYLVGIIVLTALISSLARGRKVFSTIELVYAGIVLFLGYAVLSLAWTPDRRAAVSVMWYSAPYMVTYGLAVPLIFTEKNDFRIAIVATAVVGCFVLPALLLGTNIHAFGRTIETTTAVVDRYGREKSRLNPLAVASYSGVVVLAFMLGHVGKTNRLLKVLGWIVVPIGMYLIVRSGSRGQFLGTVLAGAALVKFSYPGLNLGRLFGWVFGLGLLAVTAYVAISLLPSATVRFNVADGYENYMGTRGQMVGHLLEAWFQSSPMNIIFGLGVSASWFVVGYYPHVQPVEILAELGVFGFMMAATLIIMGAWKAVQGMQLTKRDLENRGALVAFMGFTALYFMLAFKQGSYLTNYSLFMNLAIMSKAATLWGRAKSQADLQRRQQWMHWQQTQVLANPALSSRAMSNNPALPQHS
ncbi:MAG: hypothetical protein AAGF97_00735 [Planctomycetota bacterium]